MTPRELVDAGGHAMYDRLAEIFGPELIARLLDLERDLAALLARELPGVDAGRRAWWAAQLAHVIATDGPWFSALMQPRPGKVAKALDDVHRAAHALLKALDALPPAAVFGAHMRLLNLDLPPPAVRQVLGRELAYKTVGKADPGLNRRKAAVADLAVAAEETRDGIRAAGAGKHQAERLVRYVADAFEDLSRRKATVSGTGEGAYPRLAAAVLTIAGMRDASPGDVARREAKRRHAALHSGETERKPRKVSTGGVRES
jgi:hypothetical protein